MTNVIQRPLRRGIPYNTFDELKFSGDNPDRDLFIYKAHRFWDWSIESIALGARLSSMRIIQIVAAGDRLVEDYRIALRARVTAGRDRTMNDELA